MWGLRWLMAVTMSAAAVVPAAPPPAHAQSSAQIASAKKWFAEGLALEEKGQFAEALSRFRQAMEVKKTPQIVFHVGLCESKTGELLEARSHYEEAIALAKEEKNAQVESATRAELDALVPRIPTLRIAVQSGSAPERVTIDDRELELSALDRALPLNPGSHRLKAIFAAGTVNRTLELAEGQSASVDIAPPTATEPESPNPVAPPPKPAEAPAPAPSPPAVAPASEASILPWVLVGSGVVLAAGGFYSWKLRNDAKDDLDAICVDGEKQCPADREGDVDDLMGDGKTDTTLAIVLWGAGAAAIATGGVLLVGSSDEKEPGARFSPAVGPGLAGGFVSGRF